MGANKKTAAPSSRPAFLSPTKLREAGFLFYWLFNLAQAAGLGKVDLDCVLLV
jgi:hypothetical protein